MMASLPFPADRISIALRTLTRVVSVAPDGVHFGGLRRARSKNRTKRQVNASVSGT